MSEQVYDDLIAPKLLEVAAICHEHGMPFVAQVEYAPGDYGMTADLPARDERSLPMDWMHVAARSRGNADLLIGHLVDSAKTRGHGSVYLQLLGVPVSPKDAA